MNGLVEQEKKSAKEVSIMLQSRLGEDHIHESYRNYQASNTGQENQLGDDSFE